MENLNPKNFIDIDPNIVSFITLKNGNMIVIDELTPVKPNKNILISKEEEKNNEDKIQKPKEIVLSLSEQFYFSYIGNPNNCEKIRDFNLISSISPNINFSYLNTNYDNKKTNANDNNKIQYNKRFPSTNSSIDIKSSMLQSRRDNMNVNNVVSEDNVNIHLSDTHMSNQRIYNINSKYNSNNSKLNHVNKINIDTQKYSFDNNNNINNNGNNYEKQDSQNQINNINEENINNNGYINNYNSMNNVQNSNKNNPSLIMQSNNHNFYSQNNIQRNKISLNVTGKNMTEVNTNNTNMNEENKLNNNSRKYKRVNKLRTKKRDNNYIKAVVSINIPGEEQENINLVKQFNLLVDRLNGQKSRTKAKENFKKSDRYYELYKNTNENIFNTFLSSGKTQQKIKNKNLFDINNNINNNNSKFNDIYNNNRSSIYIKKKNSNLNNRIMALKERTFTSLNNSYRNDNIKENYNSNSNNNTEIVLPSNFVTHK